MHTTSHIQKRPRTVLLAGVLLALVGLLGSLASANEVLKHDITTPVTLTAASMNVAFVQASPVASSISPSKPTWFEFSFPWQRSAQDPITPAIAEKISKEHVLTSASQRIAQRLLASLSTFGAKNGQVLTFIDGTIAWRDPVSLHSAAMGNFQSQPGSGRKPSGDGSSRSSGGGGGGANTSSSTTTIISGGDLTQSSADGLYVNIAGDTMNGALVISYDGLGLSVTGTASGKILHAESTLSSSGSLVVDGSVTLRGVTYTFPGGDSAGSGKVLKSNGAGQLSWSDDSAVGTGLSQAAGDARFVRKSGDTMTGSLLVQGTLSGRHLIISQTASFSGALVAAGNATVRGTLSGSRLIVSGHANISGTLLVLNSITSKLTVSGSNLYAAKSITGSHLYAAQTFGGAGLADCDTAGTSKLLWDSTTKRFSCGTDTDTDTNTQWSGTGALQTAFDNRYVNQSGDTMTGSLLVQGTLSGRHLIISQTASFSGAVIAATNLTTKGTLSGSRLIVSGHTNISGTLLVLNNITSKLTVSGSNLYAARSITGTHLYSAQTFGGAGLADCDTAGTSKLLWDSTTKRFSCGTDTDTDTNTQWSGTGSLQTAFDNRYVNTSGDTLTGALLVKANLSGSRLIISGNANITGALLTVGSITTRSTLSGSNLTVSSSASISGTLIVKTGITSKGSVSGSSLFGFGLGDCSASDKKLVYNNSTGTFSCASDQTGGSGTFGTGNVLTIGDSRYVNQSGDTMTGSLLVQGTLSGRHLIISQTASFSGAVLAATNLTTKGTLSGSRLVVSGHTNISGTLLVLNNITSKLTVSGSNLYAARSITGTHLYSAQTFGGAGLADCDTAGSSKLLWDSTTKRFSCGTDTDTNTTYTAGQGLTLNGTAFRLSDAFSGTSLLIYGTISGSNLTISRSASISGTLLVKTSITSKGSVSGATIGGFGLGDCIGTTKKLVFNIATSKFECATDETGAGGALSFTAAQGIYVNQSGDTMTGGLLIINGGSASIDAGLLLEIAGTSSGRVIHAHDLLTASGTLVVDAVQKPTLLSGQGADNTVYGIDVVGNYAYVSNLGTGTNEFQIFDISNKYSIPSAIGGLNLGDHSNEVQVIGERAYVVTDDGATNGNELHIIDISKPSSPSRIGGVGLSNKAYALHVVGSYAYTGSRDASTNHDFQITDISDPTNPVVLGGVNLAGDVRAIVVSGKYAYVGSAATNELQILDISDPTNPRSIGGTSFNTSSQPEDIVVVGKVAYVVGASSAFETFSVADPTSPSKIGDTSVTGTTAYGIEVVGKYAYIASTSGLEVFDVSDPTNPTAMGVVASSDTANDLKVVGKYAYVGTASTGDDIEIFDIGGIDAPSASIGTIATSVLDVSVRASIRELSVGSRLNVGDRGLYSFGLITGNSGALFRDLVGINTVANGAELEVAGTMSGLHLVASRSGTISGTLLVKESITSKGSVSGSTLFSFGLGDCSNATTSKLIYNNSTGKFSCATDQTGGGSSSFGTGNVLTIGDARYVNQSGDTMTGSLLVQATLSGRHLIVSQTASFSGALIAATNATIKGTLSGSRLIVSGHTNISGTLLVLNNITSKLTVSGSNLYAARSITGTHLYSAQTFGGAGLADCDTAGTSKLLWDSTTKRFSCGTDTDTDTNTQWSGTGALQTAFDNRYVNQSGDTMTGSLNILNGKNLQVAGSITGSTLSGYVLHADTTLSSSGSLVFEGAASGSTLYIATSINGAGLTDCDIATQTLAWDEATGRFSCGTDSDTTYTAGQGLTLNGTSLRLSDTITGALVKFTTLSGSNLTVSSSASISGTLLVKTGITSKGSLSGSTLLGFGLGDCSASDKKLVYNNSTGTFSCASDQTGGSGTFGTGNVLTIGDSRYVRKSGDTMTGSLLVQGTLSGRHLIISQTASFSGALIAATNATVKGTLSGSRLIVSGHTNISGTLLVLNNITSKLTVSGSNLYAARSITGTHLYSAQTFGGAGLADCDTAGTSKLLWDSTTKRFSCGTDTDTDTNTQWSGTGALQTAFDSRYVNQSGDTMTGSLLVQGTLSGRHLIISQTASFSGALIAATNATVKGTLSGSRLIVSGHTNISGTLLVLNNITSKLTVSGSNLYAARSITGTHLYSAQTFGGAGLADCDTAGSSKLLWDATTKRFSCGTDTDTDTNTQWSNTGSLQTAFDNRFVNTSGDTMTGSLLVQGTLSGRHLIISQTASFSGAVIAATNLTTKGTLSGSRLVVSGHANISGTLLVLNGITSKLTVSGSNLYAAKSVTGSHLYAAQTFGGAGLADCDAAGTSKLLWDSTTKRFSCGTDTDTDTNTQWSNTGSLQTAFDARYVNQSGDTMTGALLVKANLSGSRLIISGNANITGALLTVGSITTRSTLSGSNLTVSSSASISGTLIVKTGITSKGSLSGSTIDGFGLGSCNGGTSKLLYNSTTDKFECGTISASSSSFSTGNVLTIGDSRYVRKSGDTMTGSLLVQGTLSGRHLIVSQTASFSGAVIAASNLTTKGTLSGSRLIVSGHANISGTLLVLNSITSKLTVSGSNLYAAKSITGSHLYAAQTFGGAGLADCDAAGTSKLLWDSTTKRFSCGTDTDTNTQWSNTGSLQTAFDARYVNQSGDTMTGSLLVQGTLSGRHLIISQTASFSGAVLAATNLTTKGTLSGSRLIVSGHTNISGTLLVKNNITTLGTLSGYNLTVSRSASISGTLIVKTGITSKGSVSGSTIDGFGLGSCNGGTSKLLYNSTTDKFECGTITASSTFGTGNVLTIGDARYVRKSGDTMTGALAIQNGNTHTPTSTPLLNVRGTMSGKSLFITGTGSSPIIYTDLTHSWVGIGTTTPKATLDVRGTISGSNITVSRSASISGSLLVKGIIATKGTLSGAFLTIQSSATISGSLLVKNSITSKGSISGATIAGFNLGSCNGSTQKLLYNYSTAKFECGSDQTGGPGTFGTGNVLTIGDARYVNQSGDTMTGALLVQGTLSGRHLIVSQTASFSGALIAATNATIKGTLSGSRLVVSGHANISGTLLVLNGITSKLTVSGSNLYAARSITGTHLYSAQTFGGAGLADCDTAGSSKLLWDSTTKRFSCGTDTDTNTTYTAGQGLTLNGTAFRLSDAFSGTSLSIYGTISGSNLTISRSASISGTLLVKTSITSKGSVSGATIGGFGLGSCNGSTQKLLFNPSTGKFECGTDLNTGSASNWSNTGSLQTAFDSRYVNQSGDTMTGTLLVQGTLSGRHLIISQTASFSGALMAAGNATVRGTLSGSRLIVSGHANISGTLLVLNGITSKLTVSGSNLYAAKSITGSHLYAAQTFGGAGLADCDTAGSSKLLWDATTKRFSCGTDQTGGSGTFGSGNVLTIGDARYVNQSGDTMTGALLVQGTLSGRHLIVSQTASFSGAVIAATSLTTKGTLSGSRLVVSGHANISGTLLVLNGITSKLTVSGSNLYAAKSVTGSHLYSAQTFGGAGLADCDTAGSSKLLWDATTKRFSCGTDQTGGSSGNWSNTGSLQTAFDSRYVNQSGDTMTGTLLVQGTLSGRHLIISQTATVSGALLVKGVMSGRNLTLSNSASISGTLLVKTSITSKGSVSGSTIGGFGLGDCIGTTKKLVFNIATSKFECATDETGAGGGLSFTAAQGIYVNQSGDTMTGVLTINITSGNFNTVGLKIINTLSGAHLHAENLLTSSGELIIRKTARFQSGAYIAGHLIPSTTNLYDLGTNALRFRDLYLSGGTINMGNSTVNASLKFHTLRDEFQFRADGSGTPDLVISSGGRIGIGTASPLAFLHASGSVSIAGATLLSDGFEDNTLTPFTQDNNWVVGTASPHDGTYGAQSAGLSEETSTLTYTDTLAGASTITFWWKNTASMDGNLVFKIDGTTIATLGPDQPWAQINQAVTAGAHTFTWVNAGSTMPDGTMYVDTVVITQVAAGVDIKSAIFGGAVGINTTSPSALLDVRGSATFNDDSSDKDFRIESDGDANAFFVDGGANSIGIGTGTHLLAKATIYTDDSFNQDGLLIRSRETGTGVNMIKIVTDRSSANNTVFRITSSGAVYADGKYNSAGADYAEWFRSSDNLSPGEVVCIDITKKNTVKRCSRDADSNVMGIVSTNPSFVGNVITGADGIMPPGYSLIGLIGQVPAHVIIEGSGSIRAGDSLTAASIPGYARKANAGESTVGVALEAFDGPQGTKSTISVLISRRNSSLTVDAVGQKVLDTISAMKIGDEVQLLVTQATENLNLDSTVTSLVTQQLASLDLTTQINAAIDQRLSGALLQTSQTEEISALTLVQQSLSGSLSVVLDHLSTLDSRITALESTLSGSVFRFGSGYTLHAAAAIVDRTLMVNGTLQLSGSLVLSGQSSIGPINFSGSEVSIGSLMSSGSLKVIGNITITGLATFLGDVDIKGELAVSGKQAGFAVIEKNALSVTISFETPLMNVPVINATPQARMNTDWWIENSTMTGFTLRSADPVTQDVLFSWTALTSQDPTTFSGHAAAPEPVLIAFPVNALGQPVSSDPVWNGCIQGHPVLDADGQPLSCARYHEDFLWQHPDLGISFTYNPNHEPPILLIPEGFVLSVIDSPLPSEVSPEPEPEPVIDSGEPQPEPEVDSDEPEPSSDTDNSDDSSVPADSEPVEEEPVTPEENESPPSESLPPVMESADPLPEPTE